MSKSDEQARKCAELSVTIADEIKRKHWGALGENFVAVASAIIQGHIEAHDKERDERDILIGKWLSAALDDPAVCREMKVDIQEWFNRKE